MPIADSQQLFLNHRHQHRDSTGLHKRNNSSLDYGCLPQSVRSHQSLIESGVPQSKSIARYGQLQSQSTSHLLQPLIMYPQPPSSQQHHLLNINEANPENNPCVSQSGGSEERSRHKSRINLLEKARKILIEQQSKVNEQQSTQASSTGKRAKSKKVAA